MRSLGESMIIYVNSLYTHLLFFWRGNGNGNGQQSTPDSATPRLVNSTRRAGPPLLHSPLLRLAAEAPKG